jgi:hypothetical protein
MTPIINYLFAFLVIVIAYIIHRLLLTGRNVYNLSGQKLVTCPETHEPVGVKVALGTACAAALAGKEHVELSSCTRWPERAGCDQACLSELKADPTEHGIWAIAAHWYEGKNCFYCGRPITPLSHLDHPPGLVSFDGKIIEWDHIPAEKLPAQFASAHPVCWNCTVVESFCQQHPELLVVRPWKH